MERQQLLKQGEALLERATRLSQDTEQYMLQLRPQQIIKTMGCTECGNTMELKETFPNGNEWYICYYCGNEDAPNLRTHDESARRRR